MIEGSTVLLGPEGAGSRAGVSKGSGFTLVEAMVVVLLTAIIASQAVPAFSGLVRSTRIERHADELRSAFQRARQTALNTGSPVVVCKTNLETACTPSSGTWSRGWMAFIDSDGDGSRDSGERILVVDDGLESGFALAHASDDALIKYEASGALESSATFRLCGPAANTDRAYRLDVNIAGRIKTGEGDSCP